MADHFKGGKVSNISKKHFDSSFKLKKSPGKASLIVFHQPWCGFCVQLAPEYKKISTKVYSMNGELPGSQEVFAHFGITGFPTIRFLSKDGKVGSKTYLGERDASSMLKFIKSSGMSGGGKKKKVVKKKKCNKCKGKCAGGQCKKPKKSIKKRKPVKKSLKKRKPKKSLKKRKPKRKSLKKRKPRKSIKKRGKK